MEMNVTPLTLDDFKGGITDYYIGGRLDKYRRADNFIIQKHDQLGKLYTRPGSVLYDAAHPQIPAGAQRTGWMKFFEGFFLVGSSKKIYYYDPSGWQTLVGPTGNDPFTTAVTTSSVISYAYWNKHLFLTSDAFTKTQKIYVDEFGALKLRTAGMPALASAPVITPGANTGKSFLYRFTREYEYNSSGLTFLDVGPVTEVAVNNADAPEVTANAITAIPALANGATDNYDTGSVKLRVGIYRTLDTGVNFFRVGSVANGTTTFTDNVSDATLENNAPLYTEGGVVENFQPPFAKIVHVNQHFGYYANTSESDGLHPNRLYQSVPDDIDSVPNDFFIDIDDEIVGLSSVNDITMILGKKFTYRIDGSFDELGRGSIVTMKIGDTAGCVSAQSIVQTTNATFWAGPDGFYYSDAFQVVKINKDWNITYAGLVEATPALRRPRIQGKYDPLTKRIWWAVQEGGGTDNNKFYILDTNWGLSDDMPFTTASNGADIAPTSLEFVNNQLIRGDTRGYIFKHDASYFTDPKVEIGKPVNQWIQSTLFYDYQSCAMNFGTDFVRKFVTRVSIACQNETNLSLQIISNNDDARQIANLTPIRYKGNIAWGDLDVYWGDPNLIWNKFGLISDFRRMPRKNLRCLYKQVYLQPAFVAIVNSDLLGSATVNAVAKTATLTGSFSWPSNSLDYYIAFENDGYVNTYQITNRTSNVVTYTDAKGISPTGTQKWVIRGYPKGEILNLISYTLNWTPGSRTQDHFAAGETGEVGT